MTRSESGTCMDLERSQRTKVCILSLYSYPLFNQTCISPFGGSEVRLSTIARELAKYQDLEITVLVFDHGQPRCEVWDGVNVRAWPGRPCPIYADTKGSPSPSEPQLRGAIPRLPSYRNPRHLMKKYLPRAVQDFLRRSRYYFDATASGLYRCLSWLGGECPFGQIGPHTIRRHSIRIYEEVDADVYIAHGNHNLNAELAYYCKKRHKNYIMVSGSDYDFIAASHSDRNTDMYGSITSLMRFSVENAYLILVQSNQQANLAKKLFNREATVILNPVDVSMRFPRDPAPETVLWVGKSDDRVKLPDQFLELAARYPQYRFVMVMNLGITSVHNQVLGRGKSLPNLQIITFVPFDEIEKYYARAKVLVNTSLFEGFPNTYLQAGKYGVPIVSLNVDPNGMISEHGCGILCGGSFEKMTESVTRLMSDTDLYNSISVNCSRYVATHHDKEAIGRRYREVILNGRR